MPPKEYTIIEALKNEARWIKQVLLRPDKVKPKLLYGYLDSTGTIRRMDRLGVVTNGGGTDHSYVTEAKTVGAVPGLAPQIEFLVGTTTGLTAGTIYELLGVTGTYNAAGAGVGNRVWGVTIKGTSGGRTSWASDQITSAKTEVGTVYLTKAGGGFYYLDDDGSITNSAAANNPVPCMLYTGCGVTLNITDNLEDDIMGLSIYVRRVA